MAVAALEDKDQSSNNDNPNLPKSANEALIEIDFRAIWTAITRSKYWIIAIMASAIMAAIAITLLMTPKYTARATLQIDQTAAKIIGTEEQEASAAIQDADRFLQTQVDVIKSRALADIVALDLGLYKDDSFLKTMKIDISPKDKSERLLAAEKKTATIEALMDNLTVTLPLDSRVVAIEFTSPSSTLSAKIANSFAENAIRNNLQRKFETSTYARDFLQKQLAETRARLEDLEAQSNDYARGVEIIETQDDENGKSTSTLTAMSLMQLNSQYNEARHRRIAAEAEWRAISRLDPLSVPIINQNPAVQGLIAQKSIAEAELDAERVRHLSGHPNVQQSQARVNQINSDLNALTSALRRGLRSNYERALSEEQALEVRLNANKQERLNEQRDSVRLGTLEREIETTRAQYDALLTRFNDLNAEAGVQSNNMAMVDTAVANSIPVSPRPALNLAIGLVLGLMLSAAFVIIREQVFDYVRVPDHVTGRLAMPLLGITPLQKIDPESELKDPKTPLSEAYASIRSSLALLSSEGMPKSILFTSATEEEGKSITCYALTSLTARLGKKVIIIDADMRRPKQHMLNALDNKRGLSDVLSGNANWKDVVQENDDGIAILTAGVTPPDPAVLLDKNRVMSLLEEISLDFDHIFVDSPPLYGLADAVELSAACDKTVFVIRADRNKTSVVNKAAQRIRTTTNKLAGAVLTGFNAKQSGYGDSYKNYYSYQKQ